MRGALLLFLCIQWGIYDGITMLGSKLSVISGSNQLHYKRANPPTIKHFLLGELHLMIFNPDLTGHQQGLWPGVIFGLSCLNGPPQ